MTTPGTPLIVCITAEPAQRSRLAARLDGVGVLVMVPDPASASSFLSQLGRTGTPDSASVADHPDRTDVVRVGGLRLDLAHHEATWHGQRLALTPHELRVLGCLARSPGRTWTYRQLHDHAWETAYFTGPAAVQSVVKRLRAKLRQRGLPLHIDAARGLGFRLTGITDLHLVPPAAEDRGRWEGGATDQLPISG